MRAASLVVVVVTNVRPSPQARALAGEVAESFRNVLRLHRKMRRAPRGPGGGLGTGLGSLGTVEAEDEPEEPEELTEYSPAQVGGLYVCVIDR